MLIMIHFIMKLNWVKKRERVNERERNKDHIWQWHMSGCYILNFWQMISTLLIFLYCSLLLFVVFTFLLIKVRVDLFDPIRSDPIRFDLVQFVMPLVFSLAICISCSSTTNFQSNKIIIFFIFSSYYTMNEFNSRSIGLISKRFIMIMVEKSINMKYSVFPLLWIK